MSYDRLVEDDAAEDAPCEMRAHNGSKGKMVLYTVHGV